mmetsp:Transcript_14783/g.27820  ORF Transcript_14783/g.27820 Transcript_14783/m.27820 type:complete len:534 (-) Transcript_14783:27-1628(-)
MSVAQAIQESTTSKQLLYIAGKKLWLPTDLDIPVHLKTQKIHHDRRIKAASMLLYKLGDCIGCEYGVLGGGIGLNHGGGGCDHDDHHCLWDREEGKYALKRAILASCMEFSPIPTLTPKSSDNLDSTTAATTATTTTNTCMALLGIFSIVGYTLPVPIPSNAKNVWMDPDITSAVYELINRVESRAWDIPMHHAVEVRWAIRGILARLGHAIYEQQHRSWLLHHHDVVQTYSKTSMSSRGEKLHILQSIVIPNLQRRTEKLPFDILPLCLDWNSFHDYLVEQEQQDIVKVLLNEMPFHFDTITTKDGSKVEERRGTAWVAEQGIGSLAYSGKLMTPHPLPEIVKRVMRQVEEGILDHHHPQQQQQHEKFQLCHETLGTYFDCALCNHYPNEESKCKFHTDPEHGTYWERLTCVVSAGNRDVRKFAFRPIPNENEWDRYESEHSMRCKGDVSQRGTEDGIIPAVIPLFPGDVVIMDRECNDVFHHAVYGRQDIGDTTDMLSNGRVSLVLKRAMDQGNGRKGHGRPGEGRRSKRL